MEVNQSKSIWSILALQAGILNAGGFLACHRFVTHTTGFATHFGIDLILMNWKESLSMLLVPLFFLSGAMISAFYIDLQIEASGFARFHKIYFIMSCLLLFALVLGLSGFVGPFGEKLNFYGEMLLIACLCLTSGIQNAAYSTLSRRSIRTTHLTGVTTDLGVGLVRFFVLKEQNQGKLNVSRLIIIFSFIFGSAVGAYLFSRAQYWGFSLPLMISLSLYLHYRKVWQNHDRSAK